MSARPTASQGAPPHPLVLWLQAARPKTLPAAAAPVLVGTAVAWREGGLHLPSALAALLGALCIQIGTNFANDLFDARKGADTAERMGPPRAVAQGWASPRQMAWATAIAFLAAAACGLYLVLRAGWPIVALGLASIAAGVGYTAGRYALAYVGLGDLFVFLFFGLAAVVGTAYVQRLAVPTSAWLAAVPVGLLSTAILVVNNLRDAPTDAAAGKRTLVVRLGTRFGRLEYAVLVLGAHAWTVLWGLLDRRAPGVLLTIGSLPLAARAVRRVARLSGARLNPWLGRTAGVLLLHALLLSAGLLLGG